jgi:hypothetical protein
VQYKHNYSLIHNSLILNIIKLICLQNAISECKSQINEFHKLYKKKDMDMETLRRNKRNLLEYVRCWMEDIPVLNIWRELLTSISHLKNEICDLAQSDVRKEYQQLQ